MLKRFWLVQNFGFDQSKVVSQSPSYTYATAGDEESGGSRRNRKKCKVIFLQIIVELILLQIISSNNRQIVKIFCKSENCWFIVRTMETSKDTMDDDSDVISGKISCYMLSYLIFNLLSFQPFKFLSFKVLLFNLLSLPFKRIKTF
jgi:hypothetical protein